jgi:hypothetical protein
MSLANALGTKLRVKSAANVIAIAVGKYFTRWILPLLFIIFVVLQVE